jgi:Domain of unknown function (DUF4760)
MAQDKVRITLPHATFVLGLVGTAIVALLVAWLRNWQLPIEDLVKIGAAGIATTTALYAALNLSRLNSAHAETVELKRMEMTAKFIERWQDPKTMEACLPMSDFMRQHRDLPSEEVAKRIVADPKLSASALFVLNTLEGLAVQMKFGALHPQMCHSFYRGVVTMYYTFLSGLINMDRQRKANQRLYIELEQLAKSWSQ